MSLEAFLRQPPSDMPSAFLPPGLTIESHRRVLAEQLIHIGVTDHLGRSLAIIADKLGKPLLAEVHHENLSPRDELIPYALREDFLAQRPLETTLYRFALELNDLPILKWLSAIATK